VPIDDLAQDLYSHQASFTGIKKIDSKVPDNLAAILNTEEEAVSKFEKYILEQKNLVNEKFNTIEQEILRSLHGIKSKILDSLGDQLDLFKSNYSAYKKELERYYGEDKVNELTKDKFFEELNASSNARDLENKFKALLREAKNLDEMKDLSTEGIVAKLTKFKEALEANANLLPKSLLLNEEDLKCSLTPLRKTLKEMHENITLFQNSIYPITGEPVDTILLKPTDLQYLAEQIRKGEPLSLKHKISIKRDGSNFDEVMKAATTLEHKTLSVIKSRNGLVIAVYLDPNRLLWYELPSEQQVVKN